MNFLRTMQACFAACLFFLSGISAVGQVKYSPINYRDSFRVLKWLPSTAVKDQGTTGTCWCFSGTSLLESGFFKIDDAGIDLSEMFTVRNIYLEKARNYILRQGKAQFSEGGLGHDVIRSVASYGAMPEEAYSGLLYKTFHDHSVLIRELKAYLDSLLLPASRPLAANWLFGYTGILDRHLGVPPATFIYKGKKYDARSFSKDVLKFRSEDYVNLTSFTHHPYYSSFIIEVPDNFSNGSYYNIPMDQMISLVVTAIEKGYTVLWDADVSNDHFRQLAGFALMPDPALNTGFDPDLPEISWSQQKRQELFEDLTTQDDHLMHITGVERSPGGKLFFRVKNSWGLSGPFEGYIKVSETYFAMNTISLVLPRAALDKKTRALSGW